MSELTVVFTDEAKRVAVFPPVRLVLAMRALGWSPDQLADHAGVNRADVRKLVAGKGPGHMGPLGLVLIAETLTRYLYFPEDSSTRGFILKPDAVLKRDRRGAVIRPGVPT